MGGTISAAPDALEQSRAAQKAVALAQQDKSCWTRADVVKYLGRVLPRRGMEPDSAAALLEVLADRALASEFEPVVCLEAPEAVEVPCSQLRADGSQSARNTLAAGVATSYNSAQFLGHLPGRRGARGAIETGKAPVLLVDEASMMPGADLADLIGYADARDGKVIVAGDTSQLQAVENGGGMSLLAGALGYVQLTEPVRFRANWERAASLRLRAGDTSALAEYDQHGRVVGGQPEQMTDAAAAAYVALTLEGTDTLLMAARKDRIGEHAADHALPWAVAALGPVPGHPVDRLDWQRRASSIGAYRELSGYDDSAEPIGPEPTAAAPDKRAAWYEALAALGPVDGPDVRGMPDGTLLHLRDTYPTETAWAPCGSATSSARCAPAARKPAWPRSGPMPRPQLPAGPAAPRGPPVTRCWRPVTGPCTRPTGNGKACSPASWPTGPTGKPRHASSAIYPWPPTPKYEDAIRSSGLPHFVRLNHTHLLQPSARISA